MAIASSDIDRADDPSGYPVATLADSNSRRMQVVVIADTTGEKSLVSLIGAVAGATDGGVASLGVRDDALSTLSDAEGDWVPLRLGNNGALWVRPDVAYGAGAVGATVQRTTLASDDPAVTALQVIDDWDESDRAKVNLIAGQAGITAGAGAVGASTPRVTLASDDPAVVAAEAVQAAVEGTLAVAGVVELGATDNAVLDDIAAKLGTIDADTGALAAAVSGSEMQVDVVAALPAGTNAIGKLAANSGVDIGDVDVTSIVPGTGATALGKAVDDAAGATDTGIAVLAVRADTPATLTPVDGDYVRLRVGSKGHLWVRDENMWDGATAIQVGNSITAGTPATLHTPASGKKFRLIAMSLIQNASNVSILLKYGGSSTAFLTVPRTSFTAPINFPPLWVFPPNGIAPGAANDALKLDVHTGSGVFVSGTIWVIEE